MPVPEGVWKDKSLIAQLKKIEDKINEMITAGEIDVDPLDLSEDEE